ncbi:MAG: hypothetical protein LBD17_01545 [Endomicrobium sp.]|nr:hypothetical protein [Endomicrobium sp.]
MSEESSVLSSTDISAKTASVTNADITLASNVGGHTEMTFTAVANTTYHVGINPSRVMWLYFYVRNNSSSQIRVERWLSGSLYDSKTVTSTNSPVEFNWNSIYATYTPVEFRIINNNSTSVSNVKFTANFIDE